MTETPQAFYLGVMMSETRQFRFGIWAVVFFMLAISIPGWYVQVRLIQKLGRLEKRVVELESHINMPTSLERPSI